MFERRFVRGHWLALASLSILACAPTACSSGDAGEVTDSAPRTETARESISSGMQAAMERDFGLDAQGVASRLAAEAQARTHVERIEASLGDSSGGGWFDAAKGRAVIATTDPAELDAIRASGADGVLVSRSKAVLDAAQKSLDGMKAPRGINGWYVDVPTNTLVVEINTTLRSAQVDAFVAAAKGVSDAVRLVETNTSPQTHGGTIEGGKNWYFRHAGGVYVCSVGFAARSGGRNYFLTAGHCTADGGSAYGTPQPLSDAIGAISGSTFGSAGDYGRVAVTSSGWSISSGVIDGPNVSGSQEAAVGASACKSGQTTGWTCGTIRAKNQSVNYPDDGVTIYGLLRTNIHSEGGDSGGSLVSGSQAQGLLSGGNDTTTYFQPVNEALNAYGLTLYTE